VNYGQNFMETYCTSCHYTGGTFPDCSTQSSVQANATLISGSTSTTSMPKNATLTQTQITEVTTWLGCGAP